MPIARSTSALRRPASARLLRAPTCIAAMRDGPARHEFRHQRQAGQDQRADQRRDADPRMEQEADQNVDRHPGQIEQRERPGGDQEGADLIEVAQRREAVALRARAQRELHHDVVDPRAQPLVERRRDAHQDARADDVEHALEGEQRQRQHRQRDQRRHAPARKHPVVDLEHVERAGQIENVDQAAHQADRDEGVPACRQRLAQLGCLRRAGRGTGRARQRHCVPISPRQAPPSPYRAGSATPASICNAPLLRPWCRQAQPVPHARQATSGAAAPHIPWSRPRGESVQLIPNILQVLLLQHPSSGLRVSGRLNSPFPRGFGGPARLGFRHGRGWRRDTCFGRWMIGIPLMVDLDGTLTLSDTLYESFAKLLFGNPAGGARQRAAPARGARRR